MNILPRVIAVRVFASKGPARLCAAAALSLAVGPALADPPAQPQPPMNDFYQAFYRCDGGAAFSLTYDSDQPTKVELAANDGTKPVELKRATSASGFEFAAGAAKFWTDGKTVKAEDPKGALNNCKIKAK
jgi:membrane-bound inhibitor of C-type lysozyme